MDSILLVLTALGALAAIVDFIPVANVATDLVSVLGMGGAEPTWWEFALKAAETVAFLQFIMPWLEKITQRTAGTWDDNLLAKLKMILAFAVEILGAVGAFDSQLGRRLKAITGPRRTRA